MCKSNIRKLFPEIPKQGLEKLSTQELVQLGTKICDRLRDKTDLKSRQQYFAARHSLRSGLPDLEHILDFARKNITS